MNRGLQQDRRNVVMAGLSALASATLSGCVNWRTYRDVLPSPEFLPAPTPAGALPVIDAHGHFFNARDVQATGYLAGPVAHAYPEFADLLRALAPVVSRLRHLAPRVDTERELIERYAQGGNTLVPSSMQSKQFRQEQEERLNLRLSELGKELNKSPAFRSAWSKAQGRLTSSSMDGDVIGREELRAIVRDGLDGRGNVGILSDRSLRFGGPIRFAFLMLNARVDNAHAYLQLYGRGEDGPPVLGVTDVLVDFNEWLGNESVTSMRDQVLLHKQLVRLSGGMLLPLVGYNPGTDLVALQGRSGDLASQAPGLQVVKEAIEQHGFVGVKLYPPNGYLPYGNRPGQNGCSVPAQSQNRPWWDADRLDQLLMGLYEYCAKREVPVMAHANSSMGVDDQHDALAGVCGWRALNAANKVKGLTVNAGHFGGDDSDDEAEAFTRLIMEAESLRLYADIGYWDKLLGNDAKVARERLRAALSQQRQGLRVVERIMFGTDWLMLTQVADHQRYVRSVQEALQAIGLSRQDQAAVMAGNALDCFGLRAGKPNFNRFSTVYADVMKFARWAV